MQVTNNIKIYTKHNNINSNKIFFTSLQRSYLDPPPELNVGSWSMDGGGHYPSGYYTGEEKKLAQKYVFTKNFSTPLEEEIWSSYGFLDKILHADSCRKKMENTISKVKKLIVDMKNMLKEKDKKAKKQEEKLTQKKLEEAKAIKKQEELKKQIEQQKEQDKIENEKLEKQLAVEKKYQKAQDLLQKRFIKLAKIEKKDENTKPGNALLVTGLKIDSFKKLLDWCKSETGCNIESIDFNNLALGDVLKAISKAAKGSKEEDKRTIIYIKNFEKYTSANEENEKIISKLKGFLTSCSTKYKCTVVIYSQNPSSINQELFDDERLEIINPELHKSNKE